jgi:hypothetical protein
MISSKDLSSSEKTSVAKTINPGEHVCKINKITLDTPSFNKDALNLVLHLETEPIGDDFEGFFIDKDNQEKGRYAGQVGRVKTSEYAYVDGTTKTGIKVSRDLDIVRVIKTICLATGSTAWLDANDNKHETIQEYVESFSNEQPFKDKFLKFCIGGKEYLNKEGYVNHDLHLVRTQRGAYNMEAADIHADQSKLIKYNPEIHIKKKKADVESFGGNVTTSSSVSSDFEL